MYALKLIPLILLAVVTAQSVETYTIHHRFLPIPSTGTPPEWQTRGVLSLSDEEGLYNTVLTEGETTKGEDDGHGWYQVALEAGDNWPMTSIRSSLLNESSDIHLTIHVIDSKPAAIALTSSGKQSKSTSDHAITLSDISRIPLKIALTHPAKVQSLSLSPPPTVDQTGNITPPPPEKTFFQKYWLPMVGLAIFAMSQMGPDEPKGAKKE